MARISSLGRIGTVCAALALASLVAVASPAQAEAAETGASCVYEDHIATSPSLSTEPQPYSFTSVARGWIECKGTLDGHVLSGRGWFTQVGYSPSGSLAYGTGGVDLVGAIPLLEGGELPFTAHLLLTRVGLTGWGTGYINGEFAWTQYVATPCTPAACTGPPGTTATIWGTGGTFPDGKVIAPVTPAGVTATVDGSEVDVSWEPASDGGALPVTGYRIYREHIILDDVGPEATTFTDPSSGPGTHSYSVVAFNALGVESRQSEPVTVTIGEAAPWEPEPSDPFNAPWRLTADTSGDAVSDVELTWKRPRLKDVESYEIYSTRDEFSPIASAQGTEHLDPSVNFECGRSYTYYVVAIAADGTKTWSEPLAVGPFTETGEGCRTRLIKKS